MSSPCMRVSPEREIVVTVVLRRPPQAAGLEERLLSGEYRAAGREEAERAITANPQDLGTVRGFVVEQGMHVVCENPAARTIRVEGTIRQMEKTFDINMQQRRDDAGHEYLCYEGELKMPQPLNGIVEAVLGLDRRPVARSHNGG